MAQAFGLLAEFARCRKHVSGGLAGLRRGLVDARDIDGDFPGALRSLQDIAGDFLRGHTLLLRGGGDDGGDLADRADRGGDFADDLGRFLRRLLDGGDLLADLPGGLRGLVGEALDFAGDDREALAGVTGPCRLDRGVEREKIGLARDAADELDNLADLLGAVFKAFDRGAGAAPWLASLVPAQPPNCVLDGFTCGFQFREKAGGFTAPATGKGGLGEA